MSIDINNVTQCRAAWINYYYRNNSLKIPADVIQQIETKYSGSLSSWKIEASKDINEYEFSDEVPNDNTGRNTANGILNAGANLGAGIAGGAFNFGEIGANFKQAVSNIKGWFGLGSSKAGEGAANAVASEATSSVSSGGFEAAIPDANGMVSDTTMVVEDTPAATEPAQTGTQGAKATDYIMAAIAIATAIRYWAEHPNADEAQAAEDLQQIMLEIQGVLVETQEQMADAADEAEELSEEAIAVQEEANAAITEDKTLFDAYKRSYDYLKAKSDRGETLTREEQIFFKQLCCLMEAEKEDIDKVSEDVGEDVQGLYAEVGEKLEVFETGEAQITEADEMSNDTADFDSSLKTAATVEMVAMGLNAVTGSTAGIRLLAKAGIPFIGIVNAILGAASVAAGLSSLIAVAQQYGIRKDASGFQDFAEDIIELSGTSMDFHDLTNDVWDSAMGSIEDLTTVQPQDLSTPQGGSTSTSNGDDNTGDKDKDKEG